MIVYMNTLKTTLGNQTLPSMFFLQTTDITLSNIFLGGLNLQIFFKNIIEGLIFFRYLNEHLNLYFQTLYAGY